MRSNQACVIFFFGNVTFFAFQRSALPVQARGARQRHLCCTCVYRKQNTIWHSMTSNARHCLYNVQLCRLSVGELTTMLTLYLFHFRANFSSFSENSPSFSPLSRKHPKCNQKQLPSKDLWWSSELSSLTLLTTNWVSSRPPLRFLPIAFWENPGQW